MNNKDFSFRKFATSKKTNNKNQQIENGAINKHLNELVRILNSNASLKLFNWSSIKLPNGNDVISLYYGKMLLVNINISKQTPTNYAIKISHNQFYHRTREYYAKQYPVLALDPYMIASNVPFKPISLLVGNDLNTQLEKIAIYLSKIYKPLIKYLQAYYSNYFLTLRLLNEEQKESNTNLSFFYFVPSARFFKPAFNTNKNVVASCNVLGLKRKNLVSGVSEIAFINKLDLWKTLPIMQLDDNSYNEAYNNLKQAINKKADSLIWTKEDVVTDLVTNWEIDENGIIANDNVLIVAKLLPEESNNSKNNNTSSHPFVLCLGKQLISNLEINSNLKDLFIEYNKSPAFKVGNFYFNYDNGLNVLLPLHEYETNISQARTLLEQFLNSIKNKEELKNLFINSFKENKQALTNSSFLEKIKYFVNLTLKPYITDTKFKR